MADESTGTTGATFLKISPSSRLLGMGEAFTAVADDASALSANVAGLGYINNLEILFSHYEWVLDLDYEHLAVVKPMFKGLFGSKGIMGFGINYLHLPAFPNYNDWGETIGELNVNHLALITAYGQQVNNFNFGMGFKFIREQIDDITDYSYALDFGIIYAFRLPAKIGGIRTYGKRLKAGITLQNIALDDGIRGYKLPTTFKFGMSTEIINDFNIAMDVEKPFDARIRLNCGAEYNIRNYLSIRLGYRFLGYQVDSFTAGLGVSYPFGTKLVRMDGAYAPQGVLKNTTDISIGVKFPGVTSEYNWKMANILYYKGIYYYTNGDLDKAIELWNEVLKYNPEHAKAKEKIKDAEYLKQLKKVEDKVKQKYEGEE